MGADVVIGAWRVVSRVSWRVARVVSAVGARGFMLGDGEAGMGLSFDPRLAAGAAGVPPVLLHDEARVRMPLEHPALPPEPADEPDGPALVFEAGRSVLLVEVLGHQPGLRRSGDAIEAILDGLLEVGEALAARQLFLTLGALDLVLVDADAAIGLLPAPQPIGEDARRFEAPELAGLHLVPDLLRAGEPTAACTQHLLAALIVELASGRVPFSGRSLMFAEMRATPVLDEDELPDGLRPVLQRAVQGDPSARFTSLRAMRAALDQNAVRRGRVRLLDAVRATMAALGVEPRRPAEKPRAPEGAPKKALPTLPPSLARWRRWLEPFAPDLQLAVGELTRRISRLVGPLRVDTPGEDGAPNGYRGLTRRGPLDRLVPSTLALLAEHPDELVRRLVSGELLYWDLERQTETGERRAIVLVDVGPWMLGAPRIGALASLLAMAERAERAHVAFAWGIVGDDRRTLFAELSPTTITRLLASRTLLAPSAVDALEWRLSLGEVRERDDVWVLTSPGAAPLVDGASTLTFAPHFDPAQPFGPATPTGVEVHVAPRGGRAHGLVLPLPEPRAAVRLLRHPFEPVSAPGPRGKAKPRAAATIHVLEPPLAWQGTQHRLVVGTRDGVRLYHLNPNASADVARPVDRRAEDGSVIVAAAASENRLWTLEEARDERIMSRTFGPRGGLARERWISERFVPRADVPPVSVSMAEGPRMLVVDEDDRLRAIRANGEVAVVLSDVVDVSRAGRVVVATRRRDAKDVELHRVVLRGGLVGGCTDATGQLVPHAAWYQASAVGVVHRDDSITEHQVTPWATSDEWVGRTLRFPRGHRPIVISAGLSADRLQALTIGPDGQSIWLVRDDGAVKLRSVSGAIRAAAPSPTAWVTALLVDGVGLELVDWSGRVQRWAGLDDADPRGEDGHAHVP
jgi:hypothetical protein